MFAARFAATDPTAQEWASAGWGMSATTAARAREDFIEILAGCDCGECRRCDRAAEEFDEDYRVSESSTNAGRWFVERFGLSAFGAEDEAEAIEIARSDPRFDGLTLWVFPAEVIGEDEDAAVWGSAYVRVLATGEARQV